MERICKVDDCTSSVWRGIGTICTKHRQRWRKYKSYDLNIEPVVNLPGEIWKQIEEHPRYFISNKGRVKSVSPNLRIMKTAPSKGYRTAGLMVDNKLRTFLVHRLIAKAFIPNPDNKPFINHINGLRHDNRIENLEWCTQSENVQHAYDHGLTSRLRGTSHPAHKLTENQVVNILHMRGSISGTTLASLYGVSSTTIYGIWNNKGWKQLMIGR